MGLSYRVELKVHKMLRQGFGREEICKRLGVSDHFVRKELDKIRDEGRQGNQWSVARINIKRNVEVFTSCK